MEKKMLMSTPLGGGGGVYLLVSLLLMLSFASAMAEAQYLVSKKYDMKVYVHIGIAEGNKTEAKVAGVNGTASSGLAFGTLTAMDGRVTEGPNPNTTYVGQCQGLYANVALAGDNYLLPVSIIFRNPQYNSSTLQIFGANRQDIAVRTVSIVGGTGKFRFATGLLDITTYLIDPTSIVSLGFHLKFQVPRY